MSDKKASMEELLKAARELFSRWGKIGGKRSLETMTPEQRSNRARKAVAAREAKRAKARRGKG